MQAKCQSSKGQVIIEFAILLPILVFLIGGLIELGILFYNKQVLANASREAARAGIVYLLDKSGNKIVPDIDTIVQNYCKDRLLTFGGTATPSVAVTPALAALQYPNDLTVSVSFQYNLLIPSVLNMFGGNFGPTLNIAGVTIMKAE